MSGTLDGLRSWAGRLWPPWRSALSHHLALGQGVLAALLSLAIIAPAAGASGEPEPSERLLQLARTAPLTDDSLAAFRADAGVRWAVARLKSEGRFDADGTAGWRVIDLGVPPKLFGQLVGDDARLVNALIPDTPSEAARPFAIRLDTASGRRALRCLTEAVYFETGRDSKAAQAAVAQVVLNRVRHPAYPSSVCGVVYQGAMRDTGCQFSFTCDGSLKLGRLPGAWVRAETVARRALSGHVVPEVGAATNYHADYVAPYWARTVVRISQVGPHIFYRWTGPLGHLPAFTQRYSGNETNISQEVLNSWDWRVQGMERAVVSTAERRAPTEVREAVRALENRGLIAKVYEGRVRGLLNPVPPRPSPDDIAAVNARMDKMELGLSPAVGEKPADASLSP